MNECMCVCMYVCVRFRMVVDVFVLCLPLTLIPAPLRDSWQLRDAVVATVQVLCSASGDDPHQLLVVGLAAFG